MSAQLPPTIEQLRHSLCSQLISAGITNPNDIVNSAQVIEKFIYAGSENAQSPAVLKTKEPVAKIKNAETVQERIQVVTEEKCAETKVEFADVKAALMRVAKANRDEFLAIMKKFNAATVPAIQPEDFQAVIAEVEKFEAENA